MPNGYGEDTVNDQLRFFAKKSGIAGMELRYFLQKHQVDSEEGFFGIGMIPNN